MFHHRTNLHHAGIDTPCNTGTKHFSKGAQYIVEPLIKGPTRDNNINSVILSFTHAAVHSVYLDRTLCPHIKLYAGNNQTDDGGKPAKDETYGKLGLHDWYVQLLFNIKETVSTHLKRNTRLNYSIDVLLNTHNIYVHVYTHKIHAHVLVFHAELTSNNRC